MKKIFLTLLVIITFNLKAQLNSSFIAQFNTSDIDSSCQLINVTVHLSDTIYLGGIFVRANNNYGFDSTEVTLAPMAYSPLSPYKIWRGTYTDALAMPTYNHCGYNLSMIKFILPASWPLGVTRIIVYHSFQVTINVVADNVSIEKYNDNISPNKIEYYDINGNKINQIENGVLYIQIEYYNNFIKTKKIYQL